MDTAKQAAEILRDAERKLRELVGQAASSGEYAVVVQLTELARALGVLAESAMPTPESLPATPVPSGEAMAERAGLSAPSVAPAQQGGKPAVRKRKGKGAYPRFYRRDDSLVKVAWSKTEKDEYEHKAPWRVVEALAAALAQKGANGKLFAADDILPLADPSDGSEVPSYQTYLALAWMRTEGLVVQHGRRGYTVPGASRLPAAVAARFAAMGSPPPS